MDIKLFKEVTKIENDEVKGIRISSLPEYRNDMKKLKKDYNNFIKKLSLEELTTDILDDKWQNSGYYKKYFWTKIFFIDEEYKYKDLCIWIGADIYGLHVYLGTSDEFNIISRDKVFDFIIRNIDKNKKFKNFNLDTKFQFVRYTYTGNIDKINENDFINVINYLKPIYRDTLKEFVFKNNLKKIIINRGNKMQTKNIMLYGAPGVGKTHNYKRLISMIEDGYNEKTIFDTISNNETTEKFDNTTFEEIKKDKRIEFVTFHQSYSYEDFIEGFRPNKNGKIQLEKGIFKIITDRNFLDYKNMIKDNFTEDYLMVERLKGYFFGEEYCIESVSKESFNGVHINNYGGREFQLFFLDIEYFLKENIDKKETLINYFKKNHSTYNNEEIEVNVAAYLTLLKDIQRFQQKNLYLVIDEINRGNISKIFGELITLIEEDKRDNYEVTLPYSKEKFKIPSNLYIIATMNSTDKSIATIDIALRRRFTFLKMKPQAKLVEETSTKEALELFNSLNDFITNKDKANLGEDYALGHSYFMNITNDEELEFVKEYKIKPLLEEYFYGDEENYNKAINILESKEEANG
jgi:5-methylcytosine-specific restriction protein B